MSSFFLTNSEGKQIPLSLPKNGQKQVLSHVLAISVIGALSLLAIFGYIAFSTDNKVMIQNVWDGIHTVTIMIIGGFLTLVKEILNPRREIEMADLMNLADKMGRNDGKNRS